MLPKVTIHLRPIVLAVRTVGTRPVAEVRSLWMFSTRFILMSPQVIGELLAVAEFHPTLTPVARRSEVNSCDVALCVRLALKRHVANIAARPFVDVLGCFRLRALLTLLRLGCSVTGKGLRTLQQLGLLRWSLLLRSLLLLGNPLLGCPLLGSGGLWLDLVV